MPFRTIKQGDPTYRAMRDKLRRVMRDKSSSAFYSPPSFLCVLLALFLVSGVAISSYSRATFHLYLVDERNVLIMLVDEDDQHDSFGPPGDYQHDSIKK